MPKGKELAEAVLRHVLAHPEQHFQGIWTDHGDEPVGCGTTACLAGWAVILNANPGETPRQAVYRLGRERADYRQGRGGFEFTALALLFPDVDLERYSGGVDPIDRASSLDRVRTAFYTTGSEAEAVEIFANAFNLNVEDYR